ncbi:MAG: DUF1574 domain-containing protein [Bacteroidales bacterium]|nr:DUF1574 domain-containing protein [Bacteroidales bacterium]
MNFALDTVKPEWRDPEYGHRLKELWRLQDAEPARPLVVALGSSRPQMGLSPLDLGLGEGPHDPLVYNFSAAGCGPVHELLNLRRLLDAGVRPDFLLVEVLRPVLAGNGPAEKLIHPSRLGYADLARLEPYCDDPASLKRDWVHLRLTPWYSLRLNLMSHWGGSMLHWKSRQDFMWKQMIGRGWLPYFFTEIPPEKRAQGIADAHVQYMDYFRQYSISPLSDRSYRDLLAECRLQGIRVAFFVMPESATFRSWYPPGAEAQATAYLQSLSQEFSVPVFDASAWFPDGKAFADGHHLMRQGAEAFSRRFGPECVGPWVRGNTP